MKKKIIISVAVIIVIAAAVTTAILFGKDKKSGETPSETEITDVTTAVQAETGKDTENTTKKDTSSTEEDDTTTKKDVSVYSGKTVAVTKKVVKKKTTTTKASTESIGVIVKKDYWFEIIPDDYAFYRYRFLDGNKLHCDYYVYMGGGETVEKDFEYVESKTYKYKITGDNTVKAYIDDKTCTWTFNRKTGEMSYSYLDGFSGKKINEDVFRHKNITDFVTSRWDEYFELIKQYG